MDTKAIDWKKSTISIINKNRFNDIINKYFIKCWQFHVIMLIPLLYFIIFCYVPMYGITLAFKEFSFAKGISGSKWVGLKYFIEFFNSFYFWRLVKNTVLLGIYSVVFGFPVPIIFALALNELKVQWFKKLTQTISYFPYFISTVVVVGIMYNFLSISDGLINQLLDKMGFDTIDFIGSVKWFRTLYIGSSIWQGFGFGSILYLTAITGINPELYQSLEMDGGNRWHKIMHITLPGIRPTIVILLILSMGGVFSVGFEKIILMYSPGIYETSDVIQTYVYRKGILEGGFSFATAIGFFNSVINFLLLLVFNTISRKIGETSLW